MKHRATRTELNALAVAAKSGDRQAFEQLISATIGLYYHLARWVPVQDREDVVCASVLHTYRVLEMYDTSWCWLNYAGTAINRFQRQHYPHISKPLKVSIRSYQNVRHASIPDRANGVVDPSLVSFQYIPATDCDAVIDRIGTQQEIFQLKAFLARFSARDQDSALLEMAEFCAKYRVSRQRYHQLRNDMLEILRHHLGGLDAITQSAGARCRHAGDG